MTKLRADSYPRITLHIYVIALKKNKWIADLEWVNPAKQDRGGRTIDALLDAAEHLIVEKGVDATSIADIAARADCSVGAVYHHFKDKNELQRALFNRMVTRAEVAGEAALDPARWEGASILDIFRGYLEFSLKVARDHPGHKLAAQEVAKTDQAMQALLKKLDEDFHTKLRRLLMRRKDSIGHPAPELALRFAIDQCAAMIWLRRDNECISLQTASRSDAKVVEETMQSIAAYLDIK